MGLLMLLRCPVCDCSGFIMDPDDTCPMCKGAGMLTDPKCPSCGASNNQEAESMCRPEGDSCIAEDWGLGDLWDEMDETP